MEKASSVMGSIELAEELSLEYDKGAIIVAAYLQTAGLKQREIPQFGNPRHKPYPLLPSLLPHLWNTQAARPRETKVSSGDFVEHSSMPMEKILGHHDLNQGVDGPVRAWMDRSVTQ
jgi:hypothetical protein